MFDMSWGEIMVIGGVALIVIGPKDLPKALRTVGQMTAKVRRLAGEFQAQFSEAMREAELEDIKKEMEGLNREVGSAASGVSGFNPIQTIRDELKGAVESDPSGVPAESASTQSALAAPQTSASAEGTLLPAPEPISDIPTPRQDASVGWSEYGPTTSGASPSVPVDPGTLNPDFINPEVQPPLPAEGPSHARKADPASNAPAEQRA